VVIKSIRMGWAERIARLRDNKFLKFVIGKPEMTRPLGKCKIDEKMIIKCMYFRGSGLDSSGSG
jgi:hypothetical protein